MPLTRFQLRSDYGLADPELYGIADRDDPEALLEGVAMAGLVGVLRQLGDLAEFAAEIFHDLHEEVMATAARGHGLMVRVQQLEAEFPSIEKAFLSQTSHSLFFTNAGVDWHPNLHTDQNLITRGELPRFVMDSYEECRGPPRLFLLDQFDVAGAGACLKRYTDPSFFKMGAASSGTPKLEVQREKKVRKIKKKGSRWKNGETPKVVPASHAKLQQLFLEEPIENGYIDPARLVKMKKRQLNGSLLDPKTGKSYMEKFLEPPSPEHKVVYETSYSPPCSKLTSDNASESGKILDISTVSPVKSLQGKESRGSSPNAEYIILKQVVDELNEKAIDRGSSNVPGSDLDVGPDITPLTLNEMSGDRVLAVDGESKSEGSANGYISDDVTSEMDNYVDALTTMESEMDTDNEYRQKNDLGFLNIKKRETDSDANDQVESQVQFSDTQSSGNSCASDDGNSMVKKERSSFSYSDTGSDLGETSPFDGDGVAKVFSSVSFTETRLAENVDIPSDQLSINEKIPGTKSRELVVPNGRSIVETKIPDLGEVACGSCLTDTTHVPLPSDPRSSSTIGPELHETFSNCIKLGTALSDTDNNGTYLGDNLQSLFVPSHVPSQTRDDFLDLVSAESHAVVELDNGDPNIFSDALLHWSNVLDLAPEKGSDNSVDEVPQPEYADDGYSKSLVDEKIGSPCSIISPAEEQQLGSTLPEGEACSAITLFAYCSAACYLDVVKPECIVAEVDDAIPAARVDSESSTHLVDTQQIHSFSEQQFSVMKNDVTPLEHDSATLGLPYSGEKIICEGISRTIDGDEISGLTCYEDVVGGDAVPPELPPDHPNSLGNEDHVNLDERVTEAIQAEDVAMDGVTSAATDTDVDVHGVIRTSSDLNGSQPWNLLNLQESLSGSGDPLQKGLEFNAENSPEFSVESEAQEEVNQQTVAPTDLDSTRIKSVSFDHSNSEVFAGVHDSSLAKQTQNSLCLSNATTAPIFSELNNQELKSKSPHQSCLLVNSEDAVSSPASCQLEPGNELYQALELQAGQFEVKCLQGDGPSNKSLDVQFERKQSSNHIDQARHPNTSESCPEELPSKPSSPEFSSQTGGQKFDGTEQATVSLNTLTPEAIQVNMEEMLPLPPLPPMQWRVGKVQYAPPPTYRELVEHRPDSFPGIQPSIANEKAEHGIPESQGGIMPPQNPFFLLAAVANGKSQDISEHVVGNLVPSSPTSLQIPAVLNDANTLHSCLTLEKTQSLNPFLTLPETSNGRPEHGSHASEGELVQSGLNPFSSAPPVEDKTSMHNPVCSQGKLMQPPNHLAPERCLEAQTHQHTTQNIEGERENPPETSMPPDTREDEHIQHGLPTSEGEKLCSSNISSLLLVFEVGKPNGNQAIKLRRPRSPLIDAVAAHDKSKLRKATERVRPQIVPKVDEGDSLLEQIRTKSFNLKPAGVTRPSIHGPKTNLKVAAILEKANAIRQALAGSDEDDDGDSWSDS